jgi:putative protease
VIAWEGDDMIVEAKNRLDAGDVLEFLSPTQREPILLRAYKFNIVGKGILGAEDGVKFKRFEAMEAEVVHAGQKPLIKISAKDFHLIETEKLKKLLPPFSLIRKEKLQDESERLKVESRQLSHQLEAGEVKQEKYEKKRQKYFAAREIVNESGENLSTRTPRIGKDGCCGKGCNGCLMFWHDDKYAKAREILKTKKIGEML